MTIQQALDRIDAVKPNMVPQEIKVQWLSELDAMIDREIIQMHEPCDSIRERHWHHVHPPHVVDYTDSDYRGTLVDPLNEDDVHPCEDTTRVVEDRQAYDLYGDPATELLVPFPFDRLYQYYLAMKIDEVNMEIEKRNNDGALFDQAYGEYSDWYTRHHLPLQMRRGFGL